MCEAGFDAWSHSLHADDGVGRMIKELAFKALEWLVDRPRLFGCLVIGFLLAIHYLLALTGYPTSRWFFELLGVM